MERWADLGVDEGAFAAAYAEGEAGELTVEPDLVVGRIGHVAHVDGCLPNPSRSSVMTPTLLTNPPSAGRFPDAGTR